MNPITLSASRPAEGITIETDVPLQLLVSDVVLKIPPRTRIVVGETIQIKRKLPNRKRQESSLAPQPNSMEDQVYENLDHFSLEENACKEPLLWNNIQLKPDVYTGELTPMPSQWSQEDHNWFIPLPPLDLQDDPFYLTPEVKNPIAGDESFTNEALHYEDPYSGNVDLLSDLTPSSKQIIDEIRDMNTWNNEDIRIALFASQRPDGRSVQGTSAEGDTLENDQTDSDDDTDVLWTDHSSECIQIDQLDLCEELCEEYLKKQVENERSDSLDTNEVLSEFDVCDKVHSPLAGSAFKV